MRILAFATLAVALILTSVRPEPVEGRAPNARTSTSSARADQVVAKAADATARRYGLAGEVLVAKGGKVLLERGYGTIAPAGGTRHRVGQRWRLASITKQVTAALLVREYGRSLDQPVGPGLALDDIAGFDKLTLRQLLSHHSGLPNPDDTAKRPDGVPSFYTEVGTPSFCYGASPKPGSAFSYNNCDYLIAGRLLDFRKEGAPVQYWPAGMTMARPGAMGVPGYIGGKPEPSLQLASYGAAGGLMGTVRAVFDFDRELITGKLLPPDKLAELWKPEGNGSYQALGQWVFPGQLKGCAKPNRIVQRDGEIYGVQARNFIFPDDDLIVIVFTNRSSDDFPLGEVWEGKGFVFDLLSAAACPA